MTPHEPAPGGPAPTSPTLDGRYWRLWSAVATSNLGDGLVSLALPWLASLLTRDPLAISGVALATRLPWLVFSLQAGVLSDRLDRRRLMVAANSVRAVLAAGVAVAVLLDLATLPLLYLVAFGLGMCEVLFDNTSQALLPAVVPRERLERANGNLMGAQMVIADLLARPVAGALVGVALSLPFAIDAATAAISAGLIASIPGRFRTTRAPAATPPPMRTQVREGLAWLWQHRLLRTLAVALGLLNGIAAATAATFVLFAQEVLGLDGFGFGVLLTVSSIGGLLGSVLAPAVTARLGYGPSLLLAVLVPTVAFAVIATTSSAAVAGVAASVSGFTAVAWNVVTVSLRQRLIPDALLGRVNSVYRFFGWGMMPVGTLLGGALVALVERSGDRLLALRAPFALAVLVHLVLLVTISPRLTTAGVAAALAEADAAADADAPTGEPTDA
ncbi:MAG: MFS transporter [Nitriliruptoraceae bacterium]